MKNKMFFLVLVILLVVFWSSTVVEERECYIVFNKITNKYYVLNKGIHFIFPLIESYDIIYLNNYQSQISSTFKLINSDIIQTHLLITWKATNKVLYYKNIIKERDFSEFLFRKKLKIILNKIFISSDLLTINNTINLIKTPLYFNDLGLVVSSISLLDFNLKIKPVVTKIDDIDQTYNLAQSMVLNSDLQSIDMIDAMNITNIKLYRCYKKLDMYKLYGKSLKDAPSLKSLCDI